VRIFAPPQTLGRHDSSWSFREGFVYRLNVFPIEIGLAESGWDIPLADYEWVARMEKKTADRCA